MGRSLGSANPMLTAIKRCGSLVEFSLITVKATWPGLIIFKPSLRVINLQFGGKIDDTRTMLHAAMPALRSASSKLDRRSRCFPTPLVRKIFFATNDMGLAGLRCLQELESKKLCVRNLTSSRSRVNHYSHAKYYCCVTSPSVSEEAPGSEPKNPPERWWDAQVAGEGMSLAGVYRSYAVAPRAMQCASAS